MSYSVGSDKMQRYQFRDPIQLYKVEPWLYVNSIFNYRYQN
jgi:hypothetical protein